MGSGMCPQLSVIPSSEPESDAQVFAMLFSGFTRVVGSSPRTPSAVTLVSKSNNAETIVVFGQAQEIGSLPAVLILTNNDDSFRLSQLLETTRRQAGVQVLTLDGLSTSDEKVLLRFHGGGALLVVASQQIEPCILAQWIARATAAIGTRPLDEACIAEGTMEKPAFVSLEQPLQEVEPDILSIQESKIAAIPSPARSIENGRAIMEEQQAVKIPKFPSLQVTLNGATFPLNAPSPVPFENDLFQGKVLLLLRPIDPPKDDPYWNDIIWAKRKRRFLLQIQGKFKRQPRGILFAGAEVSEPMKLGLLAKGICNLLLKFLASFAGNLHYSFGDNDEHGHICAPAWNMFQNIVVTKPGETPPQLGDDLDESKESMAARASSDAEGAAWNTTDTFTMSYHSMYIDLPTWQVVKLPFAPSLDLRTFWGKSLLSICIYDTPQPKSRRHLRRDNGYYVAIQLKFLGLDAETKEEADEVLPWSFKTRSMSESNLGAIDGLATTFNDSVGPIVEELDGEEYYFFDAEEPASDADLHPVARTTGKPTEARNLLDAIDTACPMWIDMCSRGKYVTTYAVNVNDKTTIFRYASSVSDCFDVRQDQELAEQMWSPRLSACERTRRIVGQVLSSVLTNSVQRQQLEKFVNMKTIFDSSFLKGNPPALSVKKASMVRKSAFVARALSDRHWIEEWMKVTDLQIAFYNPEKMQKANLYVSLRNIRSVQKLAPHEGPLVSSYSFLEVQTLGQTIYLMLTSEEVCDGWVAYLSTVIKQPAVIECASDNSGASDHLVSVDNPSKEFLHKSSMWNCKQRRILNCRKFFFRSSCTADPTALVEDALRKALDPRQESEERNLCAFLDSAAALKQADVSTLTETERTAFFLNLYHVMIVHAFLVLGPPDSTFKWMSYFNTIAYECSDDIFSLTELEHNVVRAAMTYPSQFVARFVLPKSQFSFALTKADYRINFALNCGSLSNPARVPVYRAATLDEQLNDACRAYLRVVEVVAQKRSCLTVTLPRICVWFAEDFGDGSSNAVLRCVEEYLEEPTRETLSAYWDEKNSRYAELTLKYLPFSFECRNLILHGNELAATDLQFGIE